MVRGCFGTTEYNKLSFICKGCPNEPECSKVTVKKERKPRKIIKLEVNLNGKSE